MGPFQHSRIGNVYLLVVVDIFTKWVPNQEARTVVEAVFTTDPIHTDQPVGLRNVPPRGIQKTRAIPH